MKKNSRHTLIENPNQLTKFLDLTEADRQMMLYKVQLSKIASEAIVTSGFSVNEVVERSKVARSKVSAIKNGSISGISCDLMLKVISACGIQLSLNKVG